MDQIENSITIEELMKISVNQLSNIVVPASLTEQISIPIYRVINNLRVGLDAIARSSAAIKEEKDNSENSQEQAPEIEAVFVEENQNGSDS